MPTRRQPIRRLRHTQEFPPETIAAFTRLLKIRAKHKPCCRVFDWPEDWATAWKNHLASREGKWPPRYPRCEACQDYDYDYQEAFNEVVETLHLDPFLLLDPDDEIPYPPGSPAAERYWHGPGMKEARALWLCLEKSKRKSPITRKRA